MLPWLYFLVRGTSVFCSLIKLPPSLGFTLASSNWNKNVCLYWLLALPQHSQKLRIVIVNTFSVPLLFIVKVLIKMIAVFDKSSTKNKRNQQSVDCVNSRVKVFLWRWRSVIAGKWWRRRQKLQECPWRAYPRRIFKCIYGVPLLY